MILPATYFSGLLLMILALVCAGTWSSLYKVSYPFRYQLFNLDLAIGIGILAAAAAFTLGTMQPNELSFEDNLLITGYRLMAWALAAGFVFNLGNAILLAAISAGGIATCVPIAFGVALIIDAVLDFFANPRLSFMLLFGGIGTILAAIVLFIVSYFKYRADVAEAAKKVTFHLDPHSKEAKTAKKKARTVAPGAVAVLAIIGGILLAFPPRLLAMARETELGLAPYGLMLFFAAGFFISALVSAPFLFAFPVGGSSPQKGNLFRSGIKEHLLGILAGMMICGGILATNLVVGTSAFGALGDLLYNLLSQGAPLLAVLWGALAWKELRSEGQSATTFLWSGFIVYAIGVILIALAPIYGTR